jgi:Uncharacterized protein conserved in bacteria (DUF2188)
MSGKLFIEQREKEGDYMIRRPGADRASGREDTQAEAIERAKAAVNPDGLLRYGQKPCRTRSCSWIESQNPHPFGFAQGRLLPQQTREGWGTPYL